MADKPEKPQPGPWDHKLWPEFLKLLDAAPEWSFIGEHRGSHVAQLWAVFLAGVEAENRRMLECY